MGVEKVAGCKDVRSPLEDPPKNDIESDTSGNTHARNLQHSHGIALFRHPRESSGAAFEVCREGGEYIALRTQGCQSQVTRVKAPVISISK